MGFLDVDNEEKSSRSSSDKLDLIEYEEILVQKFNEKSILDTKYRAEEFGITYNKKERSSDVYKYDGSEVITICPEPLAFIKEFDDVSDNAAKANEMFREKIETFRKITLDPEKEPQLRGYCSFGTRMWRNKTLSGINLRPGNLNGDREDYTPVRMCDDNVHGLIAGRTGSGKSVYINALILSLLTEYAPWELDLYLADFKKVELSRYMNDADEKNHNIAYTPHVNACAATSEIRYVISLIRYLVDCMNARQEFFARLGVTKLQEFRNKYNVVLPRVLLMVDEFQQLFTEATSREIDEIQTMLNSITKLGRATGFHLVFASQEMSGTLRGNTLANFKIRMCLPCTPQISSDILGNSQATSLERGYVLINTDSGDELKNKKYRVPFIETDKKDDDDDDTKTPFYSFLDEIKLASEKFDLDYKRAAQKFYREELQETEYAYREDLDRIREKKNKAVAQNRSIFDAVILGKSVLYSPKIVDKVSFYIEKGRNKGMMIACPNPENAARIRKLIAENLFRSDQPTDHFALELNNLVQEKYVMSKAIEKYPIHHYYNCEADRAQGLFLLMYHMRSNASKLIENAPEVLDGVAELDGQLLQLLQDPEKVREFNEFTDRKQTLNTELAGLEEQILKKKDVSSITMAHPVIKFLERCSSEIVLIPADGTKVDLVRLYSYKEVISNYTSSVDVEAATKKSLDVLDQKIKNLTDATPETENDKIQNQMAIVRNKIFKRTIQFFRDKYDGVQPEQTVLSETLEKVYALFVSSVTAYKEDCEKRKMQETEYNNLLKERENKQYELEELLLRPAEITVLSQKITEKMNAFVKKVMEKAFSDARYSQGIKTVPEVVYKITENDQLEWILEPGVQDARVEICGNDILRAYMDACHGKDAGTDRYKRMVFWVNGLDEIDRISNQFEDMIRVAINQNILVIAIITSELRDSTIRKAFDYAFVTGNVEKFYDMFDIKYTKQPLDSIVVNFGVRSKGFDIPFKMYKSTMAEVQTPDFVDQLLNG